VTHPLIYCYYMNDVKVIRYDLQVVMVYFKNRLIHTFRILKQPFKTIHYYNCTRSILQKKVPMRTV
jgi:hypothetical protein